MARIILIVAVLLGLYLVGRYLNTLGPNERKQFWWRFGFVLLLTAVTLLAVSGRLHFIAAIATATIPFIKRLWPLIRYVPLLRKLYKERKTSAAGAVEAMTLAQAYDILGLEAGASKEDIIQAHRKLMQKLHPDRGGNDFLAAQLNEAKEMLMKDIS